MKERFGKFASHRRGKGKRRRAAALQSASRVRNWRRQALECGATAPLSLSRETAFVNFDAVGTKNAPGALRTAPPYPAYPFAE
jgi:hypothetical protein